MSDEYIPRFFSINGAAKMATNMAMTLPMSEFSFVSPGIRHVSDDDFENFLNVQTPDYDTTNADTPNDYSPCAQDNFPPLHETYLFNNVDFDFDTMDIFRPATSYVVQPQTLFSSLDEAREAVRRQGPTAEDSTIPQTTENMCNLVAMLKAAMKSVEHAKDSELTIQPFMDGTHKDLAIEVACWELLATLITRHTNGASFVPTKTKKETGTFSARFAKAVHALEQSKSICKHLLGPVYVNVLVDDPSAALKRVLANRKVNIDKSRVLDAGKKALGEQANAPDAANNLKPPGSLSTDKKRKRSQG